MNLIEKIAKEGTLRDIINNIGKSEQKFNLDDLEQDLYIELIEKQDKLAEIEKKGQLKFYLTRIVQNNINSKTSRYYYNYKKQNNDENISVYTILEDEDEE